MCPCRTASASLRAVGSFASFHGGNLSSQTVNISPTCHWREPLEERRDEVDVLDRDEVLGDEVEPVVKAPQAKDINAPSQIHDLFSLIIFINSFARTPDSPCLRRRPS